MNSRLKIRLRNPAPTDTFIRPDWLVENELYLDTDEQTNITLNKEIQTLTDINKITVETALDTSIPSTVKNLAVLGISMDVESIDNDYPEHSIEVDLGFNILTQNSLKVLGYDKSSNRIDIEFLDTSDNWLIALKTIFLDDLNFGTFEYTRANLLSNWQNKDSYVDGEEGYYMGHCFYGLYNTPGVLTEGDFRPLIHHKKVLDLTSLEIGWKLSCPLLETDAGRRMGAYVIREDFLQDSASLGLIKFSANINSIVRLTETSGTADSEGRKIPFPIEVIDNGNNYNAQTGVFTGSGIFDFSVKLQLYLVFSSPGGLFGNGARDFIHIELVNEHLDGTVEVIQQREFDNGNNFHVFNDQITLVGSNILVKPGEKVYVRYRHTGGNIEQSYVNKNGSFANDPIQLIIKPGQVLDIGSQLRHDLVFDYLKGLCHLYKFMILTDHFANTVYFLTPYDIEFFGEDVSGYFKSTQKDWKLKIIENTEKFNQLTKPEKNRLYSFKKSTDPKIIDLKLPEYRPLYSRYVDEGFDPKSELETFENPYFEATYNDDVAQVATGLVANKGGILHAPFLTDNNEGKTSFKIAPRCLYFGGYSSLYYPRIYSDGSVSAQAVEAFIWDKTNLTIKFPNVWMVARQSTSVSGVYPNQTFNIPIEKICYGNDQYDLYQLIYKKYDRDFRDLPTMNFKVEVSDDDYISEDFRDRALVNSPNIHTGDLLGRVIKMSGFDPEKRTADILFIADNQVSDDCIGFEVPNLCQNYPELVITKVGNTYTFTLGGTYGSTPNTPVFKWKYKQAFTWNTSNSVTTPIDNVEVLMIVTWTDGCNTITVPGYIAVNKNPKLQFTKEGNILTAEDVGEYGLTVDTTKIIYSYDGTNWILYQEPIDLTNSTNTKILFNTVTTFTESGSTPGIEDTAYQIEMHPDECPDPDSQPHPPTFAWTKVKNGNVYGYSLYKVGSYSGLDAIDKIKFREKGKGQEWTEYNNNILSQVLNGSKVIWEIQRVIIWCTDRGCPPYCSPIIEIDGNDYTDTLLTITESGTTGTTATHEQKWENPDDASNNWKVVPIDDEIYHVPELKTYILQTIGMSTSNLNVRNLIWDRWNFKTEYVYTWNIGYALNYLELHTADTGGIGSQLTVPLNITYNSGDANDYLSTAIQNAIDNYLNGQGYIAQTNYYLIVSVTGSSTKTVKISFVAKHNPVDTWIGVYAGTDIMQTQDSMAVTATTNGTKAEFQITTTSAPIVENYSPYGTQFKVRLKVSTVNYFLDDSSSNFNSLVALSPCPIVDQLMSAGTTDTGKKFSLSASLSGCSGTSSFIWMYAGLNKGGSGKVISYTNSAVVYSNVIQDIKILGSCDTATYCTYEKLIRLTP